MQKEGRPSYGPLQPAPDDSLVPVAVPSASPGFLGWIPILRCVGGVCRRCGMHLNEWFKEVVRDAVQNVESAANVLAGIRSGVAVTSR